MKIIKRDIPATGSKPHDGNTGKDKFINTKRKIAGKDIVLNVGFKEAMIRFGLTLLIPMLVLAIDKHLVIYTTPVVIYLFVSAITHFCVIKLMWRRYVKHDPPPPPIPYGENPNYPEESL